MKTLYCLIIITSFFHKSQTQQNVFSDKRVIYFYYFDNKSNQTERVSKTLGKISDSLMIKEIELIFEKNNGIIDTLKCNYTNNTISFRPIDTAYNKIVNMYLSFKINFEKRKQQFNERLAIPFKILFEQTNEKSAVSISFERKRNNLFYVSVSKLDFPFIASSIYVASEVLDLFKKTRY